MQHKTEKLEFYGVQIEQMTKDMKQMKKQQFSILRFYTLL